MQLQSILAITYNCDCLSECLHIFASVSVCTLQLCNVALSISVYGLSIALSVAMSVYPYVSIYGYACGSACRSPHVSVALCVALSVWLSIDVSQAIIVCLASRFSRHIIYRLHG